MGMSQEKAITREVTFQQNRVNSEALFAGGKEIVITHGTEEYRLRLTANGKLILTK